MATQIPLLIIKQGSDSIFITADTLFSGRVIDLLKIKKRRIQKNMEKGGFDHRLYLHSVSE